MSRAFPATSLSAGYRVPEIRDLRKSDGVEFKVTGSRRRSIEELLNGDRRNSEDTFSD